VADQLLQPRVLLALAGLVLVAAAFVRIAWWVAQRFGRSRLVLAWLAATALGALAAMVIQGPMSPDERFLPGPLSDGGEAAILATVFGLVAFGLATRSVRRRFPKSATGQPSSGDWTAGVVAWFCGAGLVYALLILMTFALFM
jgi:hypothetical protein